MTTRRRGTLSGPAKCCCHVPESVSLASRSLTNDSEPFHSRNQRRSGESKLSGGSVLSPNHPIGFSKRGRDVRPLGVCESPYGRTRNFRSQKLRCSSTSSRSGAGGAASGSRVHQDS